MLSLLTRPRVLVVSLVVICGVIAAVGFAPTTRANAPSVLVRVTTAVGLVPTTHGNTLPSMLARAATVVGASIFAPVEPMSVEVFVATTNLAAGDVAIIGINTEDNGNPQKDAITFI